MLQADLILLHPPSVYDFRKRPTLYGPISDLIPSTPIFEMYPVGFISIGEYLERAGFRVRIVNLAVRMLEDLRFDAEKAIRDMQASLFGIDLHWLPHAHGAIEVARLVKKHHPGARVIVGGLAASYYYRELFAYPEIDYVMRGDTTEEPLRQLMDCLRRREEPATVPNLAWRDGAGTVRENPFSHVPESLDGLMVRGYEYAMRAVVRNRDLANFVPFKRWRDYPITAVLTCRGCTRNCAFCGGSEFAYRNVCGRSSPAYQTPEALVQQVSIIQRMSSGPIFMLGDIRQPGEEYAERLLHLLGQQKAKNQFILELFTPAPSAFLRQMAAACPRFCLEISPESHDRAVRQASGKGYANEALVETVTAAVDAGCERVDVFFMIGLPHQTYQSVMDTVDFCDQLMSLGKRDGKVVVAPFISPLAPFLDPGSLAFEHSEDYGYRILFRTLEEHRQALLAPSWKHMLNYETQWLSRDEIAASTYEAARRLNGIKAKHGWVTPDVAQATERRIVAAEAMMRRIDDILTIDDAASRQQELDWLRMEDSWLEQGTVCEKAELELRQRRVGLRPLRALWAMLRPRGSTP